MPLHFISWDQTLTKHGIKFNEERFYKLAGVPTVTIIEMLAEEQSVNVDAPAVALEKDNSYHDMEDQVQTRESVMEVVRAYHQKLPMSVGSGSTKASVEATLKRLDIRHYFDHTVCKDDVSKPKPNPETFLKAANLMQVSPENCVVFEDGNTGIEAATTAGMFVINVLEDDPLEKLHSF